MNDAGAPGGGPPGGWRSRRWLSREFAELLADPTKWLDGPYAEAPAFDVIIVGSGYGGAVAAAELAGCHEGDQTISVCVLERGREYLPGAFPSRMSDLPRQVRGSFAGRVRGGEGLFDLRTGGDVNVVIANGLGGGSLINAGVMQLPADEVLDRFWPPDEAGMAPRPAYFRRAKRLLGASRPQDGADAPDRDNTIDDHPDHRQRPLQKFKLLHRLAPGETTFRPAALTIAMRDGHVTSGGVSLSACRLCGDCATGCNHGAKESLDTNLLVTALRRGAHIYCGATVLRVQRSQRRPDLWSVLVAHTDPQLASREGAPRWIAARKIILAAGALGSTEILLRSQCAEAGPHFSALLGQRFSSNGDLLVFGYDYRGSEGGDAGTANAIADENTVAGMRHIGPTITGVIDPQRAQCSKDRPSRRLLIEEMAVPGPLRRMTEEMLATAATLHALGACDRNRHAKGHPENDPCAVDPRRIARTSVFAVMGDDGAHGELRLMLDDDGVSGDGRLDIVWPRLRRSDLFDEQARYLRMRVETARLEGRTIPNPMWRLVPEKVEQLTGIERGPLLTVHPLGGCAIGTSAADGVVDLSGRVFDAGTASTGAPSAVHQGLVVLDGAIVPQALCANPALTITALALRAVETLRRDWGFAAAESKPPTDTEQRPLLRTSAEIDADVRAHAARPSARASISERLAGVAELRDRSGAMRRCWVELTLGYEPFTLPELFRPDAEGKLSNACLRIAAVNDPAQPPSGRLRIFLLEEWERIRDLPQDEQRWRREDAAARSYALSGTLTVLERDASSACGRTLRGFWAWLRNRGLRDAWQALKKDRCRALLKGAGLLTDALRLSSQAGAVRLFRYALTIGRVLPEVAPMAEASPLRYEPPEPFEGLPIEGLKRITYARPSNPWRQLQELKLSRLADALNPGRSAVLELDQQYLAARSQPLLRLESQRDHFEALVDLASLAATLLRALLPIHLWNTRKPDPSSPRPPQRLPGTLPGLPEPEIHVVEVDHRDGAAVLARLTRYRSTACKAGEPPVMLIHGYSAGGTTFAHPSLEPGLARYLAQRGRDVWVADLRSSCGMPGADAPWTFERIALTDIPALAERVCRVSGQAQLDIVAHCMGAAMLSMAVLSADRAAHGDGILSARDSDFRDHFRAARRELPRRIRRLVLSQVGPAVVLTQRNIFRAFVMSFAEQFLGPLRYRFRPQPDQGAAYDLLDRLLASVPYSDAELLRESPLQPWRKTRWTGTRHRMDALYGCTFSLENLSAEVLDRIDDFFGPVSMETLAQVIHFARQRSVANRIGRNRFVSPRAMARLWTFPTMSIHGEDNGLSDVATLEHMERLMREAGCAFTPVRVPGRGHQDCLIGTGLDALFARIAGFLSDASVDGIERLPVPLRAETPWLGPAVLPGSKQGEYVLGIGADPKLGAPAAMCIVAAQRHEGCWRRHDGNAMQIRHLRESPASDWFTEPLPPWARASEIGHLGVFLIYASAPDRSGPLADADVATAVDAALLRLDGRDRDAPEAPALPLCIVDLAWMREPAGAPLRIALGSCQYPPGIFDVGPAYASWRRLSARCADAQLRPQLMLLTGDQVYADATAGLFDPGQLEDRCRKPYEQWLHSAPVRDMLRRMPLYTMLDDHEIDNDCEPVADDADPVMQRRNARLRELGIDAFLRYQRGGAAPPAWGATTVHGIDLFLLDSRTGRERRCTANAPVAAMFEPAQLAALETWLAGVAKHDRPKLIVSPAALLPRHRNAVAASDAPYADRASLRSDGWDGYPASWHAVLRSIVDADVRSLVFLSGDEHLGLWVTARLQRVTHGVVDRDLDLHSIHTAGLYTPYRFANAKRTEFLLTDSFEFGRQADGTYYRCELQTRVFDGAGFTFVSLLPATDTQPWRLRCEYDDGSGAAERCAEVALAARRAPVSSPV